MLRGVQLFVSGMALAGLTFAGASIAAAQDPAPAQPAAPAAPVLTLDAGEAAILTILIKPDKTADFEIVLGKLKEALQKAEKPERKQQAAGWKIYKSTQQAQGNVVYIFIIDPVVKGQEYDISRLINEVFPSEVQELFAKYKDAFAGRAISNLTNFMSMSQ
jgi:hypothetical protein